MVTYNCELCSFSSVYSTRYREHCLTLKHLRNIETMENDKKDLNVSKVTQGNTKVTFEVTPSRWLRL